MDSAIAGLLGASIGAVSGFSGSLLTSWLAVKKEREQWLRNKDTEQERWLRDKLQEIYSNCIDYLSRIARASEISMEGGQVTAFLSQEHQREMFSDYSEAQKWLGILLIYYPARDSNHFDRFYQETTKFSNHQVPNIESAKKLRASIIDLAAKDVRLLGKLAQ